MNKLYILFILFLGIGNINAQEVPLWKQVEAGGEFSVAIKTDSSLYTWGLNTHGQLGNESQSNIPELEPIQVSEYSDWVTVSAGAYHAVAIKDSGTIYGWGYNGYSAINGLYTTNVLEPLIVSDKTNWKQVYAGLHTSFAINDEGHLYGWGKNTYGQLGINTGGSDVQVPTLINDSLEWTKVASGHDFTLFLDDKGRLFGSGKNDLFQLTDQFESEVHEFVLLDSVETYKDIAANYATGHAISQFNEIVAWGSNKYSESGNATNLDVLPVISQTDFASGYRKLYCGSVYCLAEKDDDMIYGFGTNVLGGVGISSPKVIKNAEFITFKKYDNISISIGLSDGLEIYGGHTLWLREFDKSFYCGSGANYVGQLGNGEKHENSSSILCDIATIQVSVFENPEFEEIKIYPNPTTDVLNFEVPDTQLDFLAIFSMEGKKMLHQKVQGQAAQIDLRQLNPGMYILYVQDVNGNKFNAKVVKK